MTENAHENKDSRNPDSPQHGAAGPDVPTTGSSDTPGTPGTPGGTPTGAPADDAPADDAPANGVTAGKALDRTLGTWMFVRGAWGFVFGIATVFWPRVPLSGMTQLSVTVGTADLLLLVFLVGSALLLVAEGIALGRSVTGSTRASGTTNASGASKAPEAISAQAATLRTALFGQAIVTIPGLVFLVLADIPAELRAAVAVWSLLHGLLELWVWSNQRSKPMASDFLIGAVLHVGLGIVIFAASTMGALTVLGSAGAVVTVASVLYMLGGYSRRSRARS